MSIAVDNSQTRIIDPIFDRSNFRAEFRLPAESVFQANLRLLNVGIESATTDSYAITTGALGAIQSIQLYDGAQLLDQVSDFAEYASWFNLNKTNDTNLSVRRHLDYNSLGFVQQGSLSGDQATGLFGTGDMTFRTQNPVANQIPAGGSPKKAWIDLRAMIPFLRASMVLPTTLYKQLRVVIQFKNATALRDIVRVDRTGGGAALATSVGTVLVCEEVEDGPVKDAMVSGYQGVRYEPVEFDQVTLPAITTAATNNTTKLVPVSDDFLFHGFNNKYVKKMVIIKKATDVATWTDGDKNTGYANLGSRACWDETLQCRINGVNKLAGSGVTGKNRRLAMLTDTYGDVNLIPGQQLTGTPAFGDYVDGGAGDGLFKSQGDVDYAGLYIEDYVNTLQLFVTRSGVDLNAELNQQLNLILMGTVKKSVLLDGSGRGYSIVYDKM